MNVRIDHLQRDSCTVLPPSALESVSNTALFYPCSGKDLWTSISTFAPYISDFWFVDVGYFSRPGSAFDGEPALGRSSGYSLLNTHVEENIVAEEDWIRDSKYLGSAPCIRTETYLHRPTGNEIRVHRHRRRGPTALRKLRQPLGVFFYRGDSDEGGSGTLWLTVRKWHQPKCRKRRWLIHEVLDKLVDGGLIVTDGSLCKGAHNPYRHFYDAASIASGCREGGIAVHNFTDDFGKRFECIGSLKLRGNRATLVWQVRHES